jgi:hypothetical protein
MGIVFKKRSLISCGLLGFLIFALGSLDACSVEKGPKIDADRRNVFSSGQEGSNEDEPNKDRSRTGNNSKKNNGFGEFNIDSVDHLSNAKGCSLPPELAKPARDAELEEGRRIGAGGGGGGWGGGGRIPESPDVELPNEEDESKLGLKNLKLKECAWNGRVPAGSLLIFESKPSDSSEQQSFVRPIGPGLNCKRILEFIRRRVAPDSMDGSLRCESLKKE